MAQNNFLALSPPYAVEEAIQNLGQNLRTARIRRNITIAEAAERIGTGVRAVRDAEHGKTTASIAAYFALMWLYGLLPDSGSLADPDTDTEGKRLAESHSPKRASSGRRMDNEF